MPLHKETIITALKQLDRGNPFERREARNLLGQFNEGELLKLLEQLAWDVDEESSLAMWALPTLNQEKGIPALSRLAKHQDFEIRVCACGFLGNYQDSRGIPTLIERLDDESGEVRNIAIFSLSKMGDERAIPKLQHLAETDTWEDHEDINKNRATDAILEIQNDHLLQRQQVVLSIPKIRFRLPDPLGFKWNPQSLHTFMTLARENSVGVLESFLRDESFQLRCHAAEAFIRVEGEQGIPKLLFLLEDSEPLVRWFVYGILYSWGDVSYLERFIDSALHDEDVNVRSVAILGLGKFGTLETFSLLEKIQAEDMGIDDYDCNLSDVALFAIQSLREKYEPSSP